MTLVIWLPRTVLPLSVLAEAYFRLFRVRILGPLGSKTAWKTALEVARPKLKQGRLRHSSAVIGVSEATTFSSFEERAVPALGKHSVPSDLDDDLVVALIAAFLMTVVILPTTAASKQEPVPVRARSRMTQRCLFSIYRRLSFFH